MKILKYLLVNGPGLVPMFLIYIAIAGTLISLDQWDMGIVFYTGWVFAAIGGISLLCSILWKKK